MEPKTSKDLQVVDKRRLQDADVPDTSRTIPQGRRAHSVLLGHCEEDQARELLQANGLDERTSEEMMEKWERAQSRVQKLPPFEEGVAARALTGQETPAEVKHVMEQPDYKAAFPEGVWSAAWVEIRKIIPIHPNVDVDYAESLGDATLDSADPASAVKLCFHLKSPTGFHVRVDESQKAMTVSGVNPSLEVVGLQYSQQGEKGPVLVSFMISPRPNTVAIAYEGGRYFLLNGYHRVYRLLCAGFSHVPCMVREGGGYGGGFFYDEVLAAPRPPLFPDFVDPTLGIMVPFRAVQRVVRLRPDEYFIPESGMA
jgi:hypothetical protein